MRFQPRTEDELKAETLLPEGDYDFEVMEAADTTSKAGNDMIKVKLRVFTNNGERHVYDYLMPSMGFKLRHFCESTGLLSKYDNGTLTAIDCAVRTGIASIKIKAGKDGYGPSNVVSDYVVKQKDIKRATPVQQPASTKTVADDDIPF